MFRDVYAGTNQVHLPKAELQVTKIRSIEFWAAVRELTIIYYSKCYLHDISTARASVATAWLEVNGSSHFGTGADCPSNCDFSWLWKSPRPNLPQCQVTQCHSLNPNRKSMIASCFSSSIATMIPRGSIRKSWRPWFFQSGLTTWWTPETLRSMHR